jgi:SAM-dependent methyltransferase
MREGVETEGRWRGETPAAVRAWFSSSPGRALLAAEQDLLDGILPDLFGYYLLHVGGLVCADLASASRVRNRICVTDPLVGGSTSCARLQGLAGALPIATDSVDVVVLQHVLEFEPSPHAALREVERVLVPEGHALITGFNPWSLLGLRRALARAGAAPPWSGRFVGLTRLKDWVALLGFETLAVQTAFFRPPLTNPALLERLARLESLGSRLWPYAGGVYVLLARRRVVTLTPVKPRWRPRPRVVGLGLIEPTAGRAAREGGAAAGRLG